MIKGWLRARYVSTKKVRSYNTKGLNRADDLGALPEAGEPDNPTVWCPARPAA
jgi:hypothetical protein